MREIDQNSESIQKVENYGINKNGVWRRRGGRHRALGRQLGGECLESRGNTKESKGKKSFYLLDEKESEAGINIPGKKSKLN